MENHIIRSISASGGLRVLCCTVAGVAREICELQKASATVSIALGRGIAGGALMGALLKPGQRTALKYEGNGPLRKMIIEADSDGAVRGCAANPTAEVEPLEGRWNVQELIGRAGFLTVTKDLGLGGEPYQGMVQLRSSEVGDDLAYYLTDSEQVPSAVGLSAFLDEAGRIFQCGGFLVQALPQADEHEIDAVMKNISTLSPISDLLRDGGPKLLQQQLLGDLPYNFLETREVFFKCGCNREKVKQALLTFGSSELHDMSLTDKGISVTCEFCRRSYHFNELELELLAGLVSVLPEQDIDKV